MYRQQVANHKEMCFIYGVNWHSSIKLYQFMPKIMPTATYKSPFLLSKYRSRKTVSENSVEKSALKENPLDYNENQM